ncbi:protein NO VEIN [Salvia splendens]|uniref:protein NO VEIN n=1 Tax=Salvia splendens TaxID=180675 RepID=UPI001C26698E|nr:protein NO VEIN [Salvia splendens]
MYGQNPPFLPDGGGIVHGSLQPPQLQLQQHQIHLNPNLFPNPNLFVPNLLPQFNPFLQNPNSFLQLQQLFQNLNLPVQLNHEHADFQAPYQNEFNNNDSNNSFPQQHVKVENEMAEKVDQAAKSAWKDLLKSKENVSAWRVSQAALLAVNAGSWESLGLPMQEVPSLKCIMVTEEKINAFIHCFLAARKITTLYDLEVAICESEGIKKFEELELGPLVKHPLAVHYFSLTSKVTEVYRIRTEEIISYLCEFIDTHKRKSIRAYYFLNFIREKQSASGCENLCVRVQDFGFYVNHIKQAKESEGVVLEKCYEKFRKQNGKRSKKRPLFSEQKNEMDGHLKENSQRLKSFSSENASGKHIRFLSSSSADDDSEANHCEDNQIEKNTNGSCNLLLPNGRAERVGSCPYPSATEEMERLGLKSVEPTSYTPGGGVRCDMHNKNSRLKRKYKKLSSSTLLPRKLPKKQKFDDVKLNGSDDQSLSGDSLPIESMTFITTRKAACLDNNPDEIVTREAIAYGLEGSSPISLLVNWVLPYAQRYIFNVHPDKYVQLKHSSFENLKRLKIVVVEKLFYRYKIKKSDIASKKRYQCNCLLQENILYCRQESDSHSIFLELSCLLFDGTPELHFANFLQTIKTMAESGATEEQIESFIMNSKKVPKLPDEESIWSLQCASSLVENYAAPIPSGSRKVEGLSNLRSKCKPNDFSVDVNSTAPGAVLVGVEVPESQPNLQSNLVASNLNVVADSLDLDSSDTTDVRPPVFSEKDPELEQALLTGRLGEHVAFKYFTEGEIGDRSVKWVNETNETGLPYDILLEGDHNTTEYIEVKATRYGSKNWFLISIREWQFAIEKGEFFSIAHVVLSENDMAKVTVYKNPARLCQLGNLRLAVVVPKQYKCS